MLKGNEHRRIDKTTRVQMSVGTYPMAGGIGAPDIDRMAGSGIGRAASNEAYAKFRGKLYKGGAALGVTFASYTQSKDMILKRYKDLNQSATALLAGKLKHVNKESAAGAHLEIIFGWTPLLADIQAAATTMVGQAFPPAHVSARSSWKTHGTHRISGSGGVTTIQYNAQGKVTLSAMVSVSNPNLWLAERAGLLNAGAVAWDLVPWSFVVNMFVNTGSLVNSLTDFSGLKFTDCTQTTSHVLFSEGVNRRPPSSPTSKDQGSTVMWTELSKPKRRQRYSLPPGPNLEFKLPGADLFTISMAASLFAQKFSKISSLVQPFLKKP